MKQVTSGIYLSLRARCGTCGRPFADHAFCASCGVPKRCGEDEAWNAPDPSDPTSLECPTCVATAALG